MADLYVKKPIAVEAYQWKGEIPFRPALGFEPNIRRISTLVADQTCIALETAEGNMTPHLGSYIVKGPAGEYWAVREDIWKNTYERVNS